ncbi:PilN domain-containing protein, partial [Stutzerimonas balearica]
EPVLDPQLPKQLAEREAQNGQLLQLAEYLGKLDAERAEGFVPILTALADRHPPAGLWLTKIQLRAGGHDMSLKGQSRDQELLPLYLQSLGVSPAFAGREFARFDVQRDERQLLEFTLSSHAGADDGE